MLFSELFGAVTRLPQRVLSSHRQTAWSRQNGAVPKGPGPGGFLLVVHGGATAASGEHRQNKSSGYFLPAAFPDSGACRAKRCLEREVFPGSYDQRQHRVRPVQRPVLPAGLGAEAKQARLCQPRYVQ